MSRRGVSLAADRRGRVPFAVVGVLLLVGSLALAPTLSTDPAPEDTAVERTMTEVSAASQTAVRDGVATAGRRAAAAPVLEPADTPVGRALSDEEPFRDSLRLRVYLQVRENLARLSARSDGVEATASLPAVESTSEYRRAIERVRVERAGENGTALRVTVQNITLTARRDGQVVSRRTVARTVVVPTPVAHLHEQVSTYETRLNNGLGSSGLSKRLTARLYPIAWARGQAQFGGAPISNVIANRHVSLATNGALLDVQRSVFGHSDRKGRQALAEATAVVGIRDVVAGSNRDIADQILSQARYRPASQNITTGGAAGMNESMRLGVNETADAAFRAVGTSDALNATARDAYTVRAKLVTEREHRWGGPPDRPESPGPGWEVARETTGTDATVVDTVESEVSAPSGWHAFETFGRAVDITHTRGVYWVKGNKNQHTSTSRTERVRVSVAIVGRHRNGTLAPIRGIETAHRASGSPLGGENLADVLPTVRNRLLGGGPDSVARAVALGNAESGTVSVTGERPEEMHTWMARDLRRLRERVRSLTVTADREAVGTFQTDPAARLREKLRQRRARLLDAPSTYDSAADRARVAARAEFLDVVDRRLAAQSRNQTRAQAGVTDRLDELPGGSLAELRRGLTARGTPAPQPRPTPTGPAGPVRTRVRAQPQYLTLSSVSESDFPAVDGNTHPLVVRNVNVFSVPYGNAVSEVLDGGQGGRNRVALGAAAKTLAAADATLPSNETLDSRRDRLRRVVARANNGAVAALQARVRATTDAGKTESTEIVSDALGRWDSTAARGMALANGSAPQRVATLAGERLGLSATEQDWLRLRLLRTTTRTLSAPGIMPERGVVNRTAVAVRDVARTRLRSAIADHAGERVKDIAKKRLGTRALPSGLPLAPPLGGWYATTNIWLVTVEGRYPRFAVSASHGAPDGAGSAVRYVREDARITVDADGDGAAETLGRNTPISFRADTGVVIVVPPRPRGVGDKDGNSVETSAGWPGAG